MNKEQNNTPMWFWSVTIFFLLWNIMGVYSFFTHTFISEENLSLLPEAERALYSSYPLWTKVLFAIAVFGGLVGCLGLVFRKKWAKTAFVISLAAIIPQMSYDILGTKSMEVYGNQALIMPILVIVIGIFLLWFSTHCISKRWIK